MAEQLPGWFRFPDERDYARRTAEALSELGFDSEFIRTTLTPPMQTTSNTLITAFESAAGKPIRRLGQELSGAIPISTAELTRLGTELTQMVFSLVRGDVGAALSTGVGLAKQVATQVAQGLGASAAIIPVVGAVIQAVVDVVMIFDSIPTEEERVKAFDDCQRRFRDQIMLQRCGALPNQHRPVGTGPGGMATPADLFRDVYVACQLGRVLPPTVASMYVLLCGAEAQGCGFTRREYELWLRSARGRHGKRIGIAPEVQRRMWALIKAIMFSAKDPTEVRRLELHGDQGKMGFSLLQDLARNQFLAGHWTEQTAEDMSRWLGHRVGAGEMGCPPPAGEEFTALYTTATCSSFLGLGRALFLTQRGWKGSLEEFCEATHPDGTCRKWRTLPSPERVRALEARPKTAMLTVSPKLALALTRAVGETEVRAEIEAGERLSTGKRLALAAGVLGAGYGTWTLVRSLGGR